VEDYGRGIAVEHLERVFDKFYRPPNSAPGGVGLGLWIAREIVHAHAGELGARSEVGVGSLFWFELPRQS
jgi:signal transduction histidine kinase